MKVYIKYFDQEITRIEKISQGDWIDLRSAETVEMKVPSLSTTGTTLNLCRAKVSSACLT